VEGTLMKADNIRILRGPNRWSNDTLLEVIADADSDLATPAMLGRLRCSIPQELADVTQAVWDRSEAADSHHGEACLVAELTAACTGCTAAPAPATDASRLSASAIAIFRI